MFTTQENCSLILNKKSIYTKIIRESSSKWMNTSYFSIFVVLYVFAVVIGRWNTSNIFVIKKDLWYFIETNAKKNWAPEFALMLNYWWKCIISTFILFIISFWDSVSSEHSTPKIKKIPLRRIETKCFTMNFKCLALWRQDSVAISTHQ